MKQNTIQALLSSFIDNLVVLENDALCIHPSLEKKHQPMEIFESKVEGALHDVKLNPTMLIEADKYYLSKGELDNYFTLTVGSTFITGPVHSGKTLFLISKYIIATIISASYVKNKINLIYADYADIIREFKQTITNKNMTEQELFDRYMKAHVLFIDDLFSGGVVSEYVLNIIYNIIDYRFSHNLPTLVTTNLTFTDILAMDNGDRLLRRLTEHADTLAFTTKE